MRRLAEYAGHGPVAPVVIDVQPIRRYRSDGVESLPTRQCVAAGESVNRLL